MERNCIICKKNSQNGSEFVLSDEHIFPQIIGGWITIPFVCKNCNNKLLGSNVESKLKQNAFIVTAIDKLNLHPPNKAYQMADVKLEFSSDITAKGIIKEDGKAEFKPTRQDDGSLIVPEKKSKEILIKQIERYEKAQNVSVNFDIDEFDNLPYNIVIPIFGTDICFIKRKDQKATTTISDLSEPIPFMLPAKVAFEHLSGFSYNFIMQDDFDLFRTWIQAQNMQNKVLLNTILSEVKNPKELDYKPYHFIRYSIFENDLIAIVGLFGIIRFSVFLCVLDDVSKFPNEELLDIYHVYDLNNRNLFASIPPQDVIDDDTMYMKVAQSLAKYHLSQ